MAKSTRPSLGAVMGKSVETVSKGPEVEEQPLHVTQRRPGKRRQGWVQLNTYVPEELRTKAKIKALKTNQDLSDVITELLESWTQEE